jgi:hypothetical protein
VRKNVKTFKEVGLSEGRRLMVSVHRTGWILLLSRQPSTSATSGGYMSRCGHRPHLARKGRGAAPVKGYISHMIIYCFFSHK